ncbi:MAG TPA: ferric reductase-like transmembrane domain-containing protein [Gallionellaceae bacterium]|nr:ferric reductase-like transmembrane domain-containing protein [Gallionellaceae bacterium]HQS73868.1 ferric reductase-like transmembrane domain-containing protein [Gallionellaceae bacterium]
MNAVSSSSALRRLAAPGLVLLMTVAIVLWAWPESLPLWRSVAIVSAWAGSGLLAASLLLMVREPHLAQLLGGLENMYRWHHRSGILAYVLLLCHPLALTLDSWLESPQLAWQMLAPWAHSWPVWLGWAALLLLMFGLSVTFVLRLPYRLWRHLHFSLGLGVLLGLAHVYALLGGVTLLLVLLVAAALALGWRLIASDLGVAAHPYRVTQVSHPSGASIEIRLAPCAGSLAVSPGQFVLAAFNDGPHFHGCGEYHPFSVSAIHADHSLSLNIKAFGPCTQKLQQLETDVLVRLQGPFGIFLDSLPAAPQLWVAGGIGITPFIAELRAHPRSQPTTLLYLFRNAAEAAFLDELTALSTADPKFELLAQAGERGLPDFAAMLEKIGQLQARVVYICGPAPMVNALLPHLQQAGISDTAIHFEKFDFR